MQILFPYSNSHLQGVCNAMLTPFQFCIDTYLEFFSEEMARKNYERFAQKRAIRDTMIEAMRSFASVEPADIWKAVYGAHMTRKSGITEEVLIQKIVSAENRWKRSEQDELEFHRS